MSRRRKFDYGQIATMAVTMSEAAIARHVNCSIATVRNAMRAARDNVVSIRDGAPIRRTKSRFAMESHEGKPANMPAFDHPAIVGARTIFPSTVKPEGAVQRAFKGGENSAKIGGIIRKGKWKDLPVFTLTLEERATCPTSCRHWRSCYGNNMHWSDRLEHGPSLEWRLERELGWLELQHREGFVIRLHVLGDFYSVAYVEFWRRMLDRHPSMRVFGYSARWDYKRDPIAKALIDLVSENWHRFAIRMSDAPLEACATASIETPLQLPPGAIVCPAQTGKTESCSTCGLCWQTTKNIAFIQH